MICPACSYDNRAGIAFCEQCGKPITQVAASVISATCGHTNRLGVIFCETCGDPIADPPPMAAAVSSAATVAHRTGGGLRRFGVAALTIAVVGATVGVGAWYVGRDSDEPGGQAQAQQFAGPPAADPTAVIAAVPAVLGSATAIDPYAGFVLEDDDGTSYVHNDGRWTAITPDGSIWTIPEAAATLTENGDRIAVTSNQSDVRWVEEVLAETPGVGKSGSGYVIEDYTIYRDGLIEAAAAQGVIVDTPRLDGPLVVKPQAAELGYVYSESDHAWVITRDGVILVIPDGDTVTIAGSIVAGPSGDYDVSDFEARPGHDTAGVRDILMNGKFGTYKNPGANAAPPVQADCRTLDEIYAATPTDSEGLVHPSPRDLADACENQPEAQAASRQEDLDQQQWAAMTASRRDDSDSGGGCGPIGWVCEIPVVGDLLKDGYVATSGRIDDDTICMTGLMVCDANPWLKVDNLWAELNCGSPGPGTGDNGKGEPRFDPNDYSVEAVAAQAAPPYDAAETAFATERLALARSWMPRMELSKDEQCGEILRIVARVNAYTPDAGAATSLAEADRVEIVYTLFFKMDGGRFGREFHFGDNEGFVISLTRRDPSQGQCRGTDFEFYGGRAVAHQDASDWFQETFHITERHIEDFYPGTARPGGDPQLINPCPSNGPEGGYFLHTSESKHATYYNRDICEDALAPDSAAVLIAFVAGTFAGGPVTGAAAAYVAQEAADSMPDGLKWEDGMEECEPGRTPYDLSNRVELYDDAFAAVPTYQGHFSGWNMGSTRNEEHSYAEQARGEWCGALACFNGEFHVPGFWEASAAAPPATEVIPARVPTVDRGTFTETQARTSIKNAALKMEVAGTEPTSASKVGMVVRQSPAGGTAVQPNSTVRVWIGVLEELSEVEVPDVYKETPTSAESMIEGLKLVFTIGLPKTVTDPDLDGVVAEQTPPAGTVLHEGDRVTVRIGAYEVPLAEVPNVYDLSESAAINEIEGDHFVAFKAGTDSTSNPSLVGRVVRQDPPAGSFHQEGTTIRYWLGASTDVSVPNIYAYTESAAISTMQDHGLIASYAGTKESSEYVGRVVDQSPSAGKSVAAGSTVQYWIGVAPPPTPPSFPSRQTSPYVTLAIPGSGHGTIHSLGETISFNVAWDPLGGSEEVFEWALIDISANTEFASHSMADGGGLFPAATRTLSGSPGLRQFSLEIWRNTGSGWVLIDVEDLWIYATD